MTLSLRKEQKMKNAITIAERRCPDRPPHGTTSRMKVRIIVVAVLALLTSAFFLTGCNTWKGAGKDIERAGEKMQGSD
jgi:predicted small secreted protein